ncbi:hypothetical protein [Ammoniphilus resinae]|uniref:Cysteine-rich CPCC domain-containing protein n=1 Tax=Ammoniphilus resinae TaxID=861532 RepID=A0ABS4GLN5_9BACL|nr:hypothetical protein [Ammoniphilus resinae]MBP1931161.1 hypothetical protein [Ammoniphilus resinae]
MDRCSCCGTLSELSGGVCDLCFQGDDPEDYLNYTFLRPHDYEDDE